MQALYLTARVSKSQPIYLALSEYLQSRAWGANTRGTLGVRWEAGPVALGSHFTGCGWLSQLFKGFSSRLPGCRDFTTDFSWLHNRATRQLPHPANYQESPVTSQCTPKGELWEYGYTVNVLLGLHGHWRNTENRWTHTQAHRARYFDSIRIVVDTIMFRTGKDIGMPSITWTFRQSLLTVSFS